MFTYYADDAPPTARAEVVNAVRSALATHGFADLTTSKITAETEKSEAFLYYHCDTKNELVATFLADSDGWLLEGDFRVAHFLGFHALQVLPLVGHLSARAHQRGTVRRALRIMAATGVAYAALVVLVFGYAVTPLLG